jgi:hypothetical protein
MITLGYSAHIYIKPRGILWSFRKTVLLTMAKKLWKCPTFCHYFRCNITRSNVSLTLGELSCSPIKCKKHKNRQILVTNCCLYVLQCTGRFSLSATSNRCIDCNACIAIVDPSHCCFSSQYEDLYQRLNTRSKPCVYCQLLFKYCIDYALHSQLSRFTTGRLYALSTIR